MKTVRHRSPGRIPLIERFPDSKFAPWARLFLAQCYASGLRTGYTSKEMPNYDKAEELTRELLIEGTHTHQVRVKARELLLKISNQKERGN